ncbi:MAG TPA: HEAT repeat domain-containing protein [Candidatus Sulfotelmatobacter sp.]|nr:HEAT repeat domain-containing protein [Candidatus Sulfotelmatobacter sp.]
MKRRFQFVSCLLLSCAGAICLAQEPTDIESPKHKAWDLLQTAAFSKKTDERTNGIRALGLLQDNTHARELAESALKDSNPEVRAAGATALGQMRATESVPLLEQALSDKRVKVVMAAAHSLRELKDEKSAYAIYYDLLTGERKSGDGLIARQIDTLKNPKELATIGVSEGVGFIPFAGIGWDAWRTMHKKDPNPVRAVAASYLAHDPDPATSRALVKATDDKNWIVRAAAVEAIAQRGDPSLLPKVELKLSDRHTKVRYTAAAAVIRLSGADVGKKLRTGGKNLDTASAN